ncbi:MAG TPA: ABC transporter ATP-binding protein, partial [Acidimicrobiales bacterium]|nr:ABC transporter ATP-binding protein [Acidimicrobiales bacterium]
MKGRQDLVEDAAVAGAGAGHTSSSATEVPAVSVRGLRKSYGTLSAVDGVDLEISRGEVFAL